MFFFLHGGLLYFILFLHGLFSTVVYVSEWFKNIGKTLGFKTNSEKTNTEPKETESFKDEFKIDSFNFDDEFKSDSFSFDDEFKTNSFSFDDEFADFFDDDDDDDIFGKIDFFSETKKLKGMKNFIV